MHHNKAESRAIVNGEQDMSKLGQESYRDFVILYVTATKLLTKSRLRMKENVKRRLSKAKEEGGLGGLMARTDRNDRFLKMTWRECSQRHNTVEWNTSNYFLLFRRKTATLSLSLSLSSTFDNRPLTILSYLYINQPIYQAIHQ